MVAIAGSEIDDEVAVLSIIKFAEGQHTLDTDVLGRDYVRFS